MKKRAKELSKIDRNILKLLQKDGRMSYTELVQTGGALCHPLHRSDQEA